MRNYVVLALQALVISTTAASAHAMTCSKVYRPSELAYINQPIRQLLMWEQTSNQSRWGKPTLAMPIKVVSPKRDEVEIRGENASIALARKFGLQGEEVNWPHHPLNESETPFRDLEADGALHVNYSASRSMFFTADSELYSIKVPTDRPHPSAAPQPGKADLKNDVIISMRRSDHINEVDAMLGPSPHLYVLTEVLSVADKKTGNGYLIRDLRPLQDGHLYLPAFSVPYAGREIAERLGVKFEDLWGEAFAAALGRAKALYLLRYGLEMKTPNAQNWLIQLDSNLKPTGRIYLRDVPDSNYVSFVAERVGAAKPMEADKASGYTILESLSPNWANSVWQMDEGGVDAATSKAWGLAHNRAYINTIRIMLGLKQDFDSILDLQTYLKSLEGQVKLDNYARRVHLISFFSQGGTVWFMAA